MSRFWKRKKSNRETSASLNGQPHRFSKRPVLKLHHDVGRSLKVRATCSVFDERIAYTIGVSQLIVSHLKNRVSIRCPYIATSKEEERNKK